MVLPFFYHCCLCFNCKNVFFFFNGRLQFLTIFNCSALTQTLFEQRSVATKFLLKSPQETQSVTSVIMLHQPLIPEEINNPIYFNQVTFVMVRPQAKTLLLPQSTAHSQKVFVLSIQIKRRIAKQSPSSVACQLNSADNLMRTTSSVAMVICVTKVSAMVVEALYCLHVESVHSTSIFHWIMPFLLLWNRVTKMRHLPAGKCS